jgi:IS5 family transposase
LGEDFISGLVEETAKEAMRRGLTKGKKVRVDTFVMKSNIHYPTDATLLSDGIRVVTRLVGKLREAVGKRIRERMPDYVKKARRILLKLHFHRKGKKEGEKGKTEELVRKLMEMAGKTVQQAENIGKKLSGAGKSYVKMTQEKLKGYLALTRQIMEQTRQVLAGCKQIPDRVVSLFDKGARPIVKGKSFPEVEFGRKVVLAESEGGIITHTKGYEGNPNDQMLLAGAIRAQEQVLGATPTAVATDRGFYDSSGKGEADLKAAGVRHISIPARGYKDGKRKRKEKSKIFRELQRWRAGQEAKISHLMRTFGVGKSLMRGTEGASIWLLYSVFSNNLWRMARMLMEQGNG